MTRRLVASLQKSLGRFYKMPGNFAHSGRVPRQTLHPTLGAQKFGMLEGRDLTLANDSQACCEYAGNVWGDSNVPGNFAHSGRVPAHAQPPT